VNDASRGFPREPKALPVHRSWRAWTAGVVVAATSAVIVAGLGPQTYVVCGTGHVLNRVAQRIMQPLGAGHLDGASATYCVVPSTTAWLMALFVLVTVLVVTYAFTRRALRASV
jgi:hypothetical protein